MSQPDHITALELPIPERDQLPEDVRKYFGKCDEKLGMVPNVLKAYSQNLAQLETNRSRLGKQLQTMRSSKCWTFLMVAIVIALFVFTYLFIKLFPKPRRR